MAKCAIVRIGDSTSHGGTVNEGFAMVTVLGKKAAGIGHRGYCPKCKREFVIVSGANNASYMGKAVALEGMQTSCGAKLIASQFQATVEDGSGPSNATAAVPTQDASHGQEARSQSETNVPEKQAQPGEAFNDRYRLVDSDTGLPFASCEYVVRRADGQAEYRVTDAQGYTHVVGNASTAEGIHIELGDWENAHE